MHPFIGLDLDNTLVCYDAVFHIAACREGLIEPAMPASKEKIRDAIRRLPDGERHWTRLQAIVYGPEIHHARLFDGVAEFLCSCAAAGTTPVIVSHKTEFADLDSAKVDLRKSALEWLSAQGFFDAARFGLSPDRVCFESTRETKIRRIGTLGCTHFIDDLPEVFAEPGFPAGTTKILFDPHGIARSSGDITVRRTWPEITELFFHAR